MSKDKAIEKIQYAATQIASVYACSAIFDEKTKEDSEYIEMKKELK